MPYGESRKNITRRYREKYAMLQVRVEQEEKDKISLHAKERGESVNKFINRAIRETMERDKEQNACKYKEVKDD